MKYLELAALAVKEAQKMGAYSAEAYILDAKSLDIEVLDQEIETMKFANDAGIGVRIISKDGRIGFHSSTDIEKGIKETVSQAILNSRFAAADKFNFLPEVTGYDNDLDLLDAKLSSVGIEEKIALAKRIEIAARQADKRVKSSERASYKDVEYGVALANSNGFAAYYRGGYCGLVGVMLVEAGGDVQTGTGFNFSRDFDQLSPEAVGQEAAFEGAALLGAKSKKTTKAALILSPSVATAFLSVLVPALSAESVQKGRSLFKNKMGQKVASPLISLIDNGRLDGGLASAPIDGEGIKTQETTLIKGGVLTNYLYNNAAAARDGVKSTANGRRGSFKTTPEVGASNIFIKNGETPKNELIETVKDGFYVMNVMGMHTANPISGDFSVGASGVWIKNGAFEEAVRGVAIAGNILKLLNEVDALGDDLRFFGARGAPSVRVGKITISGT